MLIYIAEAHASDEWPIGKTVSSCKQPQTIGDRVSLAARLAQSVPEQVRVWVDSMDNEFMNTYAAWPTRYFIVDSGILRFIAQPDKETFTYDFGEIRGVLNSMFTGKP